MVSNQEADSVVQILLDHVEKEKRHVNQLRPSIYMTPLILRKINPSSFSPQVVSIGPLHRHDEKLKAFEGKKAWYLDNLLKRITDNKKRKERLKECVHKVYDLLKQIKACYVFTKSYSDAEIVDMMIMDACFILEFLFMFRESKVSHNMEGVLLYHNALFDLVLLENQIPFFILEEIFKCTLLKCHSELKLYHLIDPLLNAVNIFILENPIDNTSSDPKPHHILSLLHQCYKPPNDIKKGRHTSRIPSVSDLDRAGVSFKPNENANWLMGMEVKLHRFQCFSRSWIKPTFRTPVLVVHDHTDLILRNLIAYEQSSGSNDNYVTSYAFALDTLVNTREDVAKLVDSSVLVNYKGSDDEAANFINSICKDVIFADFFYQDQFDELTKYYEGYWPKNIAKLRRIYFSSPWNMIALVAGIILFALTVVQTIFTIKSR